VISPLDVSAEAPSSECEAGLSGTAPFGALVSGSAIFPSARSASTSAPITSAMNAFIYFPAGRVAGAPVQLAMQSRVVTGQYFFGPQRTLAADLSATGLSVGGHDMEIAGDLLPGAGGLQATISANFSSPGNDVADNRTATMLMCPAGDVPSPSLSLSARTISPLSTLGLFSTTPIAQDAINALRIDSPAGAIAFTASPDQPIALPVRYSSGPNFTVTAASALPPGQPLTFDTSAVTDVLGRAVPIVLAGAQVLATTAVLSDLGFDTPPPAGALASSGCNVSAGGKLDGGISAVMPTCIGSGVAATVANGVLKLAAGAPSIGRDVDVLLALPPARATKLRVRMAVGDVLDAGASCMNGHSSAYMDTGSIAVVGPNGEVAPRLNLSCDGAMADHVVDLPGVSPLWLVVHVEGRSSMPYSMPTPGPPPVSIDQLEFL
jgi:hypothetical protein